jgi:hypothetical protein
MCATCRLPTEVKVDWVRGVGLEPVLSDAHPVLALARRDQRVRVFRPISEKVRASQ